MTRIRVSAFCAFAVLSALPFAALAQEQPAPSDRTNSPQLQEVVVTAQKFRENIQDVPLSLSAITANDINAWGATSLEQLQYSIPNLSAFQYGPGVEFIQIGGISTDVGSPTVGQYVDEMSITAPTSLDIYTPDIRMLDMQRVEVLRGPQGALYGEGSMGGTIRYITASPSLTEYYGSAEMQGGSITDGGESYRADGVLSVPLIHDVLGLRLVAGYERDGGWIDNSVTGSSNINGTGISTFRGKLLFQPTGRLKLSLLVLHQKSDQANQNLGFDGKISSAVRTPNDHQYDLVNGVATFDSGPVLVTESVGYLNSRMLEQFDLTGLFSPLLTAIGLPPGFVTQVAYPDRIGEHIINDELRFSSSARGPYHWVGGVFYQKTNVSNDTSTTTAPGSLPFSLLSDRAFDTSSEFSLYGQGSYQVTRRLDLQAGLRYYEDHEAQRSSSVNVGFPSNDYGNARFHALNPQFNLRYEFSKASMVYLNAAKGFRSGGFNLTSAGGGAVKVPLTYAPDWLWTYQLGTKQVMLERRLAFDGDVYYTNWQHVQSAAFAPGSAVQYFENGGRVSGWGTDLSLEARPLAGLTLSASYGWNNLAYRTKTADKNVGDPVDNAVHDSLSVSLDYRRLVTENVVGLLIVNYQHAGSAQITLRDYGTNIYLPQHNTVNARVGLDWGNYEVSLFAHNLFNDRHVIIPGPYGILSGNVELQPRVVGVNLKAHF